MNEIDNIEKKKRAFANVKIHLLSFSNLNVLPCKDGTSYFIDFKYLEQIETFDLSKKYFK